jgi:RecA/RadA recombinase
MMDIKKLIELTGNEYASTVDEGIKCGDFDSFIRTRSYLFNALLGGSLFAGVPQGKITVFAGETTTGKTYLVLDIVKSFLEDNENGFVCFFESEGALTKQMFTERGIDGSRVAILPVNTVQEFRTQIIKIIDAQLNTPENERTPLLFCLDSLGLLSTTKEIEDTAAGKETQDMTRARLIKGLFRTITLKLSLLKCPLIVTNHVYDEQGLFPKKVQSGGQGIQLSASTTVFLSKKKDKVGDEVSGNIITAKLVKGRLTKENSKAEILLNYKTGINPYYGLLELGTKYGLFKQVGRKFELPNGEKHFASYFLKNGDAIFTKELLEKLDEFAKKEYLYGQPSDNQDDFGELGEIEIAE